MKSPKVKFLSLYGGGEGVSLLGQEPIRDTYSQSSSLSFLSQMKSYKKTWKPNVYCVILNRETGMFFIAPNFRRLYNRLEGSLGMLSPIFIISEHLSQRIFFLSIPTLLFFFPFLDFCFFDVRILKLIESDLFKH